MILLRLKFYARMKGLNKPHMRVILLVAAQEIQEYWDNVLEGVDKPSAKRLIQFVDTSVPLGLPTLLQSGNGGKSRPPAFAFFYETKKEYPDKIVLVRVGEFYETIGIDAILLVQHAGLNPMVCATWIFKRIDRYYISALIHLICAAGKGRKSTQGWLSKGQFEENCFRSC